MQKLVPKMQVLYIVLQFPHHPPNIFFDDYQQDPHKLRRHFYTDIYNFQSIRFSLPLFSQSQSQIFPSSLSLNFIPEKSWRIYLHSQNAIHPQIHLPTLLNHLFLVRHSTFTSSTSLRSTLELYQRLPILLFLQTTLSAPFLSLLGLFLPLYPAVGISLLSLPLSATLSVLYLHSLIHHTHRKEPLANPRTPSTPKKTSS